MTNGDVRPTILVVDDDPNVGSILARLLDVEGYDCIVTGTGSEALPHISNRNLGAAVVDVHLPDMNGLALVNVIRVQHGPQVPVVVISGDSSRDILIRLSEAGASYFFHKSLPPKALTEYLRNALS